MAHSVSLPDSFYEIVKEAADRNRRSVPSQLAYWAKRAKAYELAAANDWLDVYNAELLIEASERVEKGEITEIKDVEAHLRQLRK